MITDVLSIIFGFVCLFLLSIGFYFALKNEQLARKRNLDLIERKVIALELIAQSLDKGGVK